MTNEHIELVKKWLEGECFSAEVLKANRDAARDISRAAADAADATSADDRAAHDAAYDAADATAYAAYAADVAWAAWAAWAAADVDDYARDAAYWIKKYEELTK